MLTLSKDLIQILTGVLEPNLLKTLKLLKVELFIEVSKVLTLEDKIVCKVIQIVQPLFDSDFFGVGYHK